MARAVVHEVSVGISSILDERGVVSGFSGGTLNHEWE
jgi:hypothetical protein